VLVVEDDPFTRDHFTRALRLEGFSTTSASDGHEAIIAVKTCPPDVVLLDLRLPRIDGLECLRQIRMVCAQSIPVAIITGDYFVDDHQLVEIAALGARIWYKPLFIDQLLSVVRELLSA
jgi:two-component system OmpR family response regulator